MKKYFLFYLLSSLISVSVLNAQIEKPKPATSGTKPKSNTTIPTPLGDAMVEVTWKGPGAAKIEIGNQQFFLNEGGKKTIQLKAEQGYSPVVHKSDLDARYYSGFIIPEKGKGYLEISISTSGMVIAKYSSEKQSEANIKVVETNSIEPGVRIYIENSQVLFSLGNQTWHTFNLDVTNFRNGAPIMEAKTAEEWKKAGAEGKPAWCSLNSNKPNEPGDGKLYNWYAVHDPRGLAPSGWHIPNDGEWKILINNLGGASLAGKKMKSTSEWYNNGNGTNSSGFNSFPLGIRDNYGAFKYFGNYSYYWSSSDVSENNAGFCSLSFDVGSVDLSSDPKVFGFSVRCLKD